MLKKALICLSVFALLLPIDSLADKMGGPARHPKNPPRGIDVSNIARTNRTHRKGNLWLTVTNWGFFGNFHQSSQDAFDDPEFPGVWAPQGE